MVHFLLKNTKADIYIVTAVHELNHDCVTLCYLWLSLQNIECERYWVWLLVFSHFLFFIFCGFWPWVAFSSLLVTQVLLEILPSCRIRVSEWAFHSLSFLLDFLEEFEDFGQLILFLKRIGPYLEMHHSKAFLEEFWYCLSKFLRKRLIDNWASINTFLDKIKAVSICQKN